jgi:hypothetical protein
MLWPFCKFYGHLVYFVVFWYIFTVLVCLKKVKSGNPALFLSEPYVTAVCASNCFYDADHVLVF